MKLAVEPAASVCEALRVEVIVNSDAFAPDKAGIETSVMFRSPRLRRTIVAADDDDPIVTEPNTRVQEAAAPLVISVPVMLVS